MAFSKDFEPAAQSIRHRIRQAHQGAGKRTDGPTSIERAALIRLGAGQRDDPFRLYRFTSMNQTDYPNKTMARIVRVPVSGCGVWRGWPRLRGHR